jgi:hypothetical protein
MDQTRPPLWPIHSKPILFGVQESKSPRVQVQNEHTVRHKPQKFLHVARKTEQRGPQGIYKQPHTHICLKRLKIDQTRPPLGPFTLSRSCLESKSPSVKSVVWYTVGMSRSRKHPRGGWHGVHILSLHVSMLFLFTPLVTHVPCSLLGIQAPPTLGDGVIRDSGSHCSGAD